LTKHIHIDMIGGLAGDMFLAASLNAGLVEKSELEKVLSMVGIGQIAIALEQVKRYGIKGWHVSFSGWPPEQERDHRHLSEIEEMITSSALEVRVKTRAIEMFRELGKVESDTHDIPLEHVHFHEIGAIDSILDFVGAAYVIEAHQGATWSAGHVPTGQGMVQVSHGPMPALAPATAKLLEGFSLRARDIEGELVTPTGATILKVLGLETPSLPSGVLRGEGYGAGTKDFDGFANVVRLTLYDTEATGLTRERVVRCLAEIDDDTPEVLAHAEQVFLELGALDVVRTPVMMKKGRAGTQLAVLCRPEAADAMARAMLVHTSTFGVRFEELERVALEREIQTVETSFGKIEVKVGSLDGVVLKGSPEYNSCAAAAREHDVSIREVYDAARLAWRQQQES